MSCRRLCWAQVKLKVWLKEIESLHKSIKNYTLIEIHSLKSKFDLGTLYKTFSTVPVNLSHLWQFTNWLSKIREVDKFELHSTGMPSFLLNLELKQLHFTWGNQRYFIAFCFMNCKKYFFNISFFNLCINSIFIIKLCTARLLKHKVFQKH